MISVLNVTKTFEDVRALDELTMTVPRGAIYGLVGPNGSGKSTIIRHICGVYRPDSGKVLIDGVPVYENDRVKERMFCIPDDGYYFMQASITDMMNFYKGIYPTVDMARYEKFKEVFSIGEKSVIRRLSKGMQKQVAFWLTMCCRPKYLILDEPVDGLDPVMRRQVWSLMMADVSEHGTTVLVSSHNLRELEDVCDHVGIMNKGRVLLERSLTDLQENIVKVQAVWNVGNVPVLPAKLQVLHMSHVGRVYTYIIRGNAAEVKYQLEQEKPLMLEALPLSLEEIFIYELGGEHYAVKEIIL